MKENNHKEHKKNIDKAEVDRIWETVKRLKKEGKLPEPTEEDILNEPTALAFTPYVYEEDDFSDWDVTLNDGLEDDLLDWETTDEVDFTTLNDSNKELYSKIEHLIIEWGLTGDSWSVN